MKNDQKTVLFLDCDGVLNASTFGLTWPDMVSQDVIHPDFEKPFKISSSFELGAALVGLNVEIRWLTTWGHAANELIAPLYGLPSDLQVQAIIDDYYERRGSFLQSPSVNWKQDAIISFIIKEKRPFIWIDDEMDDDVKESIDFKCFDLPHLLIAPSFSFGLTKGHIVRMKQFIAVAEQRLLASQKTHQLAKSRKIYK